MGGGVVAEFFRDHRIKPTPCVSLADWQIQWGGVVAEISGIAVSLADSVGGGGSSRNVWASPITISQPHSVGEE